MQGGAKKRSPRRRMSWYARSSSANLRRLERQGRNAERLNIIEKTMSMAYGKKNSKALKVKSPKQVKSRRRRSTMTVLKVLERQGRTLTRQRLIETKLKAYSKKR